MAELPTARCPITELLVTDCAHCRKIPDPGDDHGAGRAGAEIEQPPGPWFTARFTSRCGGCETTIHPGDDIRADGTGGYQGRCCEGTHG